MSSPINSSEEIRKILEETILSSMIKKGNLFLGFSNELISHMNDTNVAADHVFQNENFEEQRQILNKALESKKSVLILISEYFPELTNDNILLENRLATFNTKIEEWVREFSKSKVVEQTQERFRPLEGDPAWLRILKFGKNTMFTLSVLPKRTSNYVRKLRKKEPKAVRYWSHIVPEQSLINWFFRNEISMACLPFCEEVDLNTGTP